MALYVEMAHKRWHYVEMAHKLCFIGANVQANAPSSGHCSRHSPCIGVFARSARSST